MATPPPGFDLTRVCLGKAGATYRTADVSIISSPKCDEERGGAGGEQLTPDKARLGKPDKKNL